MGTAQIRQIGKYFGIVSAVIPLPLWIYLIISLQSTPDITNAGTWVRIAAMIALSLAGIFTALFEKPLLMAIVFLLQFLPIGLYMLGVPSVFRWIGICNLVFFLAAATLFAYRYKIAPR